MRKLLRDGEVTTLQFESLAEGLVLGFAFTAPLGPQNLFLIGLASRLPVPKALGIGLLIGTVDFTLALACFFGLGALIDSYPATRAGLVLLGGLFLLYLGIKFLRTSAAAFSETRKSQSLSILQLLGNTIVLTWFNAQAIIDGAIIFGGVRASIEQNVASHAMLAGIAIGSFSWFLGLAFLASQFRHFLGPKLFAALQILCGICLILFSFRLFFSLGELL